MDRDLVVIHLYQQPGAGWGELEFYYVSRLRSASAFDDVEFNCLTFFKSLEAFSLDRRVVNEYVAAFVGFDETIALLCVKPFNFTLHVTHSLRNQVREALAHKLTITFAIHKVNCRKHELSKNCMRLLALRAAASLSFSTADVFIHRFRIGSEQNESLFSLLFTDLCTLSTALWIG